MKKVFKLTKKSSRLPNPNKMQLQILSIYDGAIALFHVFTFNSSHKIESLKSLFHYYGPRKT